MNKQLRQTGKLWLQGHSRYQLEVRRCDAVLDVFSFTGEEHLCAPYHYTIDFTSTTRDIDPVVMLKQSATFTLQAPDNPGQVRKVHGVITRFNRISTSRDETHYQVCLEPCLALLRHTRRCAIYQNQSVPDIVEKILRERHAFRGQDFLFTLSQDYPKRELVVQWQESDLDFVHRILAEVGIWYRFDVDSRLGITVVRFGDNQRNYQYDVLLPLHNPAGMNHNANDSVWGLHVEHQVVTQGVKVRDYNYREVGSDLQFQVTRERDTTTEGEVYRYGDHFLTRGEKIRPQVETAAFYARLHHERDLCRQHIICGKSSSPLLAPGQVLEVTGESPAVLKKGLLIVSTQSSARRDSNYLISFSGIPYSEMMSYRPALIARPVIAGTVPARVTSDWPNDTYGHIDKMGRYRIKFDFDLDEWPLGGESLWVRLARPYAGSTYGFHWPLVQGTEVAVAFEQGNPDRPYIAHALHDSRHEDHVTRYNYKRNVLRTPANNKLRMDDERGKEHIKLSTEYGGKSQLNLGHLVDRQRPHPNKRGEGFELRTDDWGAIRAGKGLLLNTQAQPKASGKQLDMDEIKRQLTDALSLAESLSDLLQTAQIDPLDKDTQRRFLQQHVEQLQQPVIVAGASGGIAWSTPQHIQHSAGKNLIMTGGGNTEISSLKRMVLAAKKSVVVFAHELGMKLVAVAGKIQMQAQTDGIEVTAMKGVTITSTDDEILISAKKKITLQCGGSYLTLEPSKIEHGSPGDFNVKSANFDYAEPAKLDVPYPNFTACDKMVTETTDRGDATAPLG
ncbi:type VI secretion system tip protein VgrG [Photorhabdus temperata]|nr:type VI secretion system tip protein VgrG [Photorhabdus temperata]